jgi:hypothetical protein
MIEDPVERRSAENAVEGIAKRKPNEVADHELRAITELWPKVVLRMPQHVAGEVECDDSAARQILQQKAGQLPGSATGVQNAFVAAEVQFA